MDRRTLNLINLGVLLLCVTRICLGQDCQYPDCLSSNQERCDDKAKYRTVDGTCNNLEYPLWGSKYSSLITMILPNYDAGHAFPKVAGAQDDLLLDAKEIGEMLSNADIINHNDSKLSQMVFVFGQFLDHDIDLAPVSDGNAQTNSGLTQIGTRLFEDTKSKTKRETREANGSVTAYIDASNVYGSVPETMAKRDTQRAEIVKEKVDQQRILGVPTQGGQMLETEISGVSALVTLFTKEHDRIAKKLKHFNKLWNSDRLFQETRKIVGAIIQKITYEEFIPTILGPNTIRDYEYDIKTHAGIFKSFATAYYRFTQPLKTEDYQPLLNAHLRRFFTVAVEKNLSQSMGGDFLSLNIQRDRYNALPSYNAFRHACGLEVATSFDDMPDHNEANSELLKSTYKHPDDIELAFGGLTENLMPNSLVGPVFKCILERQFQRLKQGDRFRYQTRDPVVGFSRAQINEIEKVTLAKVICDNSVIPFIQPDVFRVPNGSDNKQIPCSKIVGVDFSVFKERARSTPEGDSSKQDSSENSST